MTGVPRGDRRRHGHRWPRNSLRQPPSLLEALMVESRRTEESKRAATSPAQPREFSTSTSGNYKPQLRAAVPSSGLGGCAAAPAGQQLNCLRAKDPDMYQLCKGCLGLGTSALIDCLSSKTACPARPPPGALGGCTKFTHGQNLNCLRDNDRGPIASARTRFGVHPS
ncbi:hypothetical protein PtA15_16A337 [Puccinia triticina]|uniref:Uncharacterized protein n=1 Tax=Puccinia triticina TaxID=208348 RepID=A0ABY7D462_9BASI|nr:uncharacterized protein PtA15_16A337 [Puccinia triticina]WAQ92429.1 hypothetical protein PtA15_16A337 [Puccinia triticina]